MSEWRENIERVRRAIRVSISKTEHEEVIAALDALTAQIEEIQRDSAYSALAATVLTAQIEELEREVELRGLPKELMQRLHRAEQRVKELERFIVGTISLWDAKGPLVPSSELRQLYHEFRSRAALAQSDPPED